MTGAVGEGPSSGEPSGLSFALPIQLQSNHLMLQRSSISSLCEFKEPQIGGEAQVSILAGPSRSGRMALRKTKPPQIPIPTLEQGLALLRPLDFLETACNAKVATPPSRYCQPRPTHCAFCIFYFALMFLEILRHYLMYSLHWIALPQTSNLILVS